MVHDALQMLVVDEMGGSVTKYDGTTDDVVGAQADVHAPEVIVDKKRDEVAHR